jgi:hypothetical protein
MKKPERGKKTSPPHLMHMRVNPTASMITVDVAKENLSMAKTRNPGKIKVKNETRNHLLYCGKPNHKKNDCRKYKSDLAEGKVANKNEQKGGNGAAMTAEYRVSQSARHGHVIFAGIKSASF